ncbi:MAG: PEP/pyruvate-binding domain-containing protein [Candidatus Dojkabacteria bacterium]|nr:PEP/pyruvate-binding domain-containing protein [Candidatus Dojkabacteria bacterium]
MEEPKKDIIVVPFSKIKEVDASIVGTKAYNIGKVYDIRIPVPQGFVITTFAQDHFIMANGLEELISQELSNLDPADSVRLEDASKKIRRAILKGEIEQEAKKIFERAYASLSGFTDTYVAIRSSFPFEDLVSDPFSKQSSTYLNVKGKKDLVEKIKYCWASIFTPQNLFFLMSKGYDLSSLKVAVIVQKMIQAEVSGILFTQNPIDNDASKVSIESVLGLGETLSKGELVPDNYLVEKEGLKVIEKKIVPQDWMLVRKGRTKRGEDPNVKVKVSEVWKVKQKLENKYITSLVKLGLAIEKHFGQPMEIEWIYEGGRIWIVQSRPITKLEIKEDSWKRTPTFAQLKAKVELGKPAVESQTEKTDTPKTDFKIEDLKSDSAISSGQVLIIGKSGNEGLTSGTVSIVKSVKQLSKVKRGSILITELVTPQYEGKLKGVVGIVTDEIGRDSYAQIISKSLGIPSIVDTKIATKVLRNSEYITIDGGAGKVYSGKNDQGLMKAERILQSQEEDKKRNEPSAVSHVQVDTSAPEERADIKTATKLFLDIRDPNAAPNLAVRYVDGVGFYDSSEIIRKSGIHPQIILKKKKLKKEFVNELVLGLYRVARSFEPRPVLYHLSSLLSSEYFLLEGAGGFEPKSLNPKIGQVGASRFIKYPEELELELEAIRVVRNKENVKNISIVIPYVRTYKELKEMKRTIASFGFRRSTTFRLFFRIDVPYAVMNLERLLDLEVDGVVVNVNRLSETLLAADSNLLSYKTDHSALKISLAKVIQAANKYKVSAIIGGDALGENDKLLKEVVKLGATAICTKPDGAYEIKKKISDYENSLLLKRK